MSTWNPNSLSSNNNATRNQFKPSIGVIPHFDHLGCPPSEQERILYEQEKQRERLSVVNQPHRTFPVVTPKPKPIHDYPLGSYLKYVKDPTWQQAPRVSSPVPRPDKLREVMNKFASEIDTEKVVHLQYNSPLNVYSKDSIAETLVPQANKCNQQNHPASHHSHQNPRPTTPLTDIRKSPTWQLIQEQEQAKAYGPPKERVYSPVGATFHVSSIDGHESPIQSQTFKHLMTSLVDHPAY